MRALAHFACLAAALCFALTFFDIAYQGASLIHFTGLELSTGTTFASPFRIGGMVVEIGHVPALPAADAALACLGIAAAIFWVKGREGRAATVALALVGALSLYFLRWEVAAVVAPRFPGAVLRYSRAYWCCVALAWLGTTLALAALLRREEKSAP